MYRDKTVFVLGAGASFPYNYPLGKGLIKDIIDNINDDVIYLPYPYNVLPAKEGLTYKFQDYSKIFNEIDPVVFDQKITSFPDFSGRTGYQTRSSYKVIAIKLNELDEFTALKEKLFEVAPVSIDAFLRDNPSYANAGKIMIIYSLLKRESKRHFNNTNQDNWLSHFIDEIANINIPEDLLKHKLSIVTFNYDVSIEYCFYSKLLNFERFQANGIAEQFIKTLPIYHVYGQLYKDNFIDEYGKFNIQGDGNLELKTQCFIKALKYKDCIKLMGEERATENSSIREVIKNSETIIVIGFSFDPANLVRLGFPETHREMITFMENKTFKYLNYNGEMKGLDSELMKLNKYENNTLIVASHSNSISNAYVNSFRRYFL